MLAVLNKPLMSFPILMPMFLVRMVKRKQIKAPRRGRERAITKLMFSE